MALSAANALKLEGAIATKGKRTKSFITNNINSVLVLNTKFEDRYPDEGKAFPTYEANNPPDARKMRPAVNTTTFV